MTKTTKVIAALGVVAGLGVAALPLSSYAADNKAVSGTVYIETEIASSIAMRIHSNADDYTYTAVETPSGNPSEQGYYEKDGDVYTASTDTEVNSSKTYYTRGSNNYGFIGYNPASYQDSSDYAPVAGPSQATGLVLAANDQDTTTLNSSIEVRSNTGKFTLTVTDNDTDTALRNSETSTTTGEFIPALAAAADSLNSEVASWAIKGGDLTQWTPMVASDATAITVKAEGANTASPEAAFSSPIVVNYGVSSGATKTGTYFDTIKYTATAQN